VSTIIKINRTGKSGDGKIFVMQVADTFGVRTGEGGDGTLDDV
jgi:nitrogen regulatory protein PII 2